MVKNWHDPILVLRDYLALVKLNHALAGIYIWELVFTSQYELDVLRRKKPYQWTIWIYILARYTGLTVFIVFFVLTDGGRVPCQPVITANYAFLAISWAFASAIIVIRVIAIWDRQIFVSAIAIVAWMAGLAFNIRNITMVGAGFDVFLGTCVVTHTQRALASAIATFAVTLVLLTFMLVGLLRDGPEKWTEIGYLLYQQCAIWIVLAGITEIPPVIFLALNLNDPWNEMFTLVEMTILTIGAARLYRGLSMRGSITEYSSKSAGLPTSANYALEPTMRFARRPIGTGTTTTATATTGTVSQSVSQSEQTMRGAPVFITAGSLQARLEFVPGGSNPSLEAPGKAETSKDVVDYRVSQLPSMD